MSSSDLAVSARNLGKRFTLVHKGSKHSTLAEQILHTIRHPFQRIEQESFWACRDLNFDIHKGEVVGFIGKNGAGKSTLLKILSQITEPTTGHIELYGNVGSLLEVGTGFHPELTGRENIYLNGAILGMRRREIQKQFDAIVDFAGVEKFLDTPVKRYSSGMYVRLAFAVAAHLEPDILIIDEVLAVGDAEFQKKCLGKMQEVARGQGRTVLFVSHNIAAVRQLCTQAIYLQQGRLVKQGPTDEVLDLYAEARQRSTISQTANEHGIAVMDVSIIDPLTGEKTDRPGFSKDYLLNVHLHFNKPLASGTLTARIIDEVGTRVSSICTVEEGISPFTMEGDVRLQFNIPKLGLYPGRYLVSLEVKRTLDPIQYLMADDVMMFEVMPEIVQGSVSSYERSHGITRIVDRAWVVQDEPMLKVG
jgi:lipopolysaccharide transport system ATP-binding protein